MASSLRPLRAGEAALESLAARLARNLGVAPAQALPHLRGGVESGAILALEGLDGAVLSSGTPQLRTVELALPWEKAKAVGLVAQALAHMQADPEGPLAIMADSELNAAWEQAFPEAGFSPFHRLTMVQDLRLTAEGWTLPPLAEGYRHLDIDRPLRAFGPLVALANAGSPDSLFLTMPRFPTVEAVSEALEALEKGAHGPFHPELSGMVLGPDGEAVGVILVAEADPQNPTFYEVAVHPEHRGAGLSRVLLRGYQRRLIDAGYKTHHCFAMATNGPVHRLYRPEEVKVIDEHKGWYWFRPASS